MQKVAMGKWSYLELGKSDLSSVFFGSKIHIHTSLKYDYLFNSIDSGCVRKQFLKLDDKRGEKLKKISKNRNSERKKIQNCFFLFLSSIHIFTSDEKNGTRKALISLKIWLFCCFHRFPLKIQQMQMKRTRY